MTKRWNGMDLDRDRALVEGLCRSARLTGADSQEREKLELLLRICETARRISPRDRDILQAMLGHSSRLAAARDLMPESPSYQTYLSRRLKKLKQLAENFLCENSSLGLARAERQGVAPAQVTQK